jgi:fluoride exporter
VRHDAPNALPWIALGGALGALGRFGLSGWVTTWASGGFPWGTFAANVLGSLALGVILRGVRDVEERPAARGFLVTGLCGGFTTFSTFDYEVLALVRGGHLLLAGVYATASVVVCVAGVLLGMRAAQRWSRT